MAVYILEPDAHITSLNRITAAHGFRALGHEVREFSKDAFEELDLTSGDIVVGGIHYARRGMERLGLTVPDLEPVPEPLVPFAGRKLWRAPLQEVRRRISAGEVFFTKPAPDQPKLFDGTVLSGVRDLIATAHLDDDLVVDCAEPVNFVSEYRCFVLRGDVLGLRPYRGDPLQFPDPSMVRAAIAAYDPAPVAYALDIGVTEEGRSLVVEVNDSYACGAYGLFPIRYANFIAARWEELAR